MTPEMTRVLAVLTTRPQTLAQIADRAYLDSRRAAEQAVHDLRLAGYPIVSAGRGVRLSDDPAEVDACADALGRRAAGQFATRRALRATAKRMRGTPAYLPVETPLLWDERLGRSQGGEL